MKPCERRRALSIPPTLKSLPAGHDSPVTGGGYFLKWPAPLLAFARMATQPKILILDEATANIDSETEEVI